MFLSHKILLFRLEAGIHLSDIKTLPIRSCFLIKYITSHSPILLFCGNTLLILKLMVYMLSGRQEGDHGSFTSWLRAAVGGLLGRGLTSTHTLQLISVSHLELGKIQIIQIKKILVPNYYSST